jgi:hypothetical protein
MRIFVLFILFDAFEVPFDGFRVLLKHLVCDTNIVVATGIVRSNFDGFFIPENRLIVIFLGTTVGHANLIECPGIKRIQSD